ncbi:MAG: ATP-grasp domain-containing protein [Candidatus Saccharimonadales bacterium]
MKKEVFVLAVSPLSTNLLRSMSKIRQRLPFADLGLIVLAKNPGVLEQAEGFNIPVELIACRFSSPEEIDAVLAPFKGKIRAVVCRGDKNIQYLREVVAHLPGDLPVAPTKALEIATDKRLMREAFLKYAPEITPKFAQVHDSSRYAVDSVETKLQYPVIVKPANLASSLLIQTCYSRSELSETLERVFNMIGDIYKKQDRSTAPSVIVEEFLEGDFYSVDSYVMRPGEFYHCPVVGYIPAKTIGIDDFFLYKRFLPSGLTEQEVAAAFEAVEKALTAIGLTHSTAHVEMVKTKQGWKIIEIGPRLGRFRHVMYEEAYGIDHSLNDLLIHLGEKPVILMKLRKYCSAYSIYPHDEGVLCDLPGLKKLEQDRSTVFMRVLAQKGDVCLHAKNGGGALAEFVIADENVDDFESLTKYVEENTTATIDQFGVT